MVELFAGRAVGAHPGDAAHAFADRGIEGEGEHGEPAEAFLVRHVMAGCGGAAHEDDRPDLVGRDAVLPAAPYALQRVAVDAAMPIGPLAALAYDRACPADCERRFGFGWPGAEPEFGVVAAACGLMYPVHGLSVYRRGRG